MALQLVRPRSSPAYLNPATYAIGQAGPVYAWQIDKNVSEPVAVAMLPVLTGQIAQRGLLILVCDASIDAPALKSFAAASAARAILRSYYYKVEPSNYSHMLFQAMLEGIREANTEIANHFWPDSDQPTPLALTDNLAGISATAVVAYDNNLVVGTVGNTRAYRIRNGKLALYEQGEPERLIVLKDDFRKNDRVFICTHALADANGAGRIRATGRTSITSSPEAIRALIEDADRVDPTEITAAAMLYRSTAAPALLTSGRATTPTLASPASKMMRWLTLASILVILGVGVWLLLENRRTLSDGTPNSTSVAPVAAVVAPQLPTTTGLMPVPVMESQDSATTGSLSATDNLSVVITTSEAGIVVFQRVATETPGPTPTAEPSATLLPTPRPTLRALVTQAQTVVRATATVKPSETQAPEPTSPPPQPTSPPPQQPTSPPPQPTSPPPQPTSPPPQPTSPPPQPTSPPPQPTSPPPQPTTPPPEPTAPPPQPTPELVVPCLPGDTQCQP